ncbi:unnamed protein product [Acanthoscelides obtectus]|uniref:Uncharacterized protein n=1 Tax=Acanthoscelides obtectus TaxID=200917 RepID=A0A9P0MJH5_ACAOB|nr:unnamed protein product [Acanthoscelides obtectus]CAK1685761.1 hypothetical protein AOBTE_LOCUS35597 [Acanthoscelides obtectus]
MMSCRSTISCK